ncbi:MAG: XdhC family protein [Jatrophihabitans sp.]
MYEIAEQVREWSSAGREVRLAQIVASRGFSSRDHGATLAWTEGAEPVGSLLDGLLRVPVEGSGLVEVTITDSDAGVRGLSCGGQATVLVLTASSYPVDVWDRLIAREPLCLVTSVPDAGAVETRAFTPDTIRQTDEYDGDVPRLFARGTSTTVLLEGEGVRHAVVSLWPVPTMLVVGDGLIADALVGAASFLGWTAQVVGEADAAEAAIASLRRSDAVVVLSHDRVVDGPSLAAALRSRAGYVGALGARRTQAARRDWLLEHDVAHTDIDRVHGPAGLDIDAHTPSEIAVSIVAEILAVRSESAGGNLRDRPGPVHTTGVNAPPPRYEHRTPRVRPESA